MGLPSIVLGGLAIIFWHLAKRDMRKQVYSTNSVQMNTAGLICGLVGLCMGLIGLVWVLASV